MMDTSKLHFGKIQLERIKFGKIRFEKIHVDRIQVGKNTVGQVMSPHQLMKGRLRRCSRFDNYDEGWTGGQSLAGGNNEKEMTDLVIDGS